MRRGSRTRLDREPATAPWRASQLRPGRDATALTLLLALTLSVPVTQAQLPGDANCDGTLGEPDRQVVTAQIFAQAAPPECQRADVNGDGTVTSADLVAIFAGPRTTFIGLASGEGIVSPSLGTLEDGTEVFFNGSGVGFRLVVEAAAAPGGAPVGDIRLDSAPGHPERRPDLQIQVDRALGAGSSQVCDQRGVPAVSPPDYSLTQSISDALNDLACRFEVASIDASACTLDPLAKTGFVAPGSEIQFCLGVSDSIEFPAGDTRVTVRLRDRDGKVGSQRHMLLRIEEGPFPATFTPRPPTPTQTPTVTITRTATFTTTPTRSGTPTATATTSQTPRSTSTATVGPTNSATSTPRSTVTPRPTIGPEIVFFGIIGPDNVRPPETPGSTPDEIPLYSLPFGFGFSLVIEVKPGPSGRSPGTLTFNTSGSPDLQIQATRPLGNGSVAVCDNSPPSTGGTLGGVPAIEPPSFSDEAAVTDRLNDLGCRFVDGAGEPLARNCTADGCVKDDVLGDLGCLSPQATAQFCGAISQPLALPPGDTLFTARVLDEVGNPGREARLVIRIGATATAPQ